MSDADSLDKDTEVAEAASGSEGRLVAPDVELPEDLLLDETIADLEARADEFDDPELKTSPEVLRPFTRSEAPSLSGPSAPPMVVVACPDEARRDALLDGCDAEGWHTVSAGSFEQLLRACADALPHVVLVDVRLQSPTFDPLPDLVRAQAPDRAVRVVALLSASDVHQQSRDLGAALEEGYDDVIAHPENLSEVRARAAANLGLSRALRDLEIRRRQTSAFSELTHSLASSVDLHGTLHQVSRQIADFVQIERCSILLLDSDAEHGIVVAASDDPALREQRIALRAHPELLRCVARGTPLVVDDSRADPSVDDLRAPLGAAGVRTLALFPIVFEGRVTGLLILRSARGGRVLTLDDLTFGQTIATACAVAIRNAHLFDSIRDQNERMTYMRLVAERQMEALKRYEDFFEYAAEGMAIVSTDAAILYVNREGRRLLADEQAELRARSLLDFVAEASRPRWHEIAEGMREERFRRSLDFYVVRSDGAERVFWLSVGSVGQDTGLIVLSFRDVTETREMELELRTTKEFLENLIDNSVDAIVAADMSGTVILFNKGAEKLFGYDADDVIGEFHVSRLYPELQAQEILRQLRDNQWGGRGRLEAHRNVILHASRETIPVSMTASIIYEDGEEVATVGVLTDLRERLKIEQRLSDAQEELIKNEKARVAADLAGMAAHELNQPLTSVLGYAEMLRHRINTDDAKMRRCVDTIYEQAERMAEIVRKIGRITKYETKHYGARTTMMDLERASAPQDTPEITQSHARVPGAHPTKDASVTGEGATLPPRPAQTQRIRKEEWLAAMAEPAPGRGQNSEAVRRKASDLHAIIRADSLDDTQGHAFDADEVTDPLGKAVKQPGFRSAQLMDELHMEPEVSEVDRTHLGVKPGAARTGPQKT